MNRRADREPRGESTVDELALPYTKVDGWGVWIGAAFFFGGPIGFSVFTLSEGDATGISFGLLLLAGGLPIAAWLAIGGWRQATGTWWLRLSHTGFEVNDRLRPRRYRWADIEQFMLVDSDGAARVAFRYRPRRDYPSRAVDGYVLGYWDRSFAEAVELMNEWLTRSRGAGPG